MTAAVAPLMNSPAGDAIVCSVSAQAARAAIALAGRAHGRVIVVDSLGPVPAPGITGAPVPLPGVFATDLLSRLEVPVPPGGVGVETRTIYGFPAATLTEIAREEHAALVVVGAEARRRRGPLRTFPVRLALRATTPVLVIREDESIRRWLDREITLRVLVAIDRSPAARTALEWAPAFAGDLPMEVVAAGLDPPCSLGTGTPPGRCWRSPPNGGPISWWSGCGAPVRSHVGGTGRRPSGSSTKHP